MKNGPDTVQHHAHPRARALRYFGPQSNQQRLNIPPGDVSADRVLKKAFENPQLFLVHRSNRPPFQR